MERRGRIPVAKFRTQESKTRSRSRVREPDYNEQDPETDLFTLLEDNIALKEENKELKTQLEDFKKERNEALEEKNRIREQLFALERQQESTEMQIREIMGKFTRASNERNALDKLHKMKIETINNLEHQLQSLQLDFEQTPAALVTNSRSIQANNSLREKLLKILPNLNNNNELESLVDVETVDSMQITNGLVERLVDEFLNVKNSLGSIELQLYEANEKIAELIENQHHLEEESETLRSENTNLTKVAKLLTENMKESVETSKKMEIALIKLKQRNDELVAKSRDWTDGQSSDSQSPSPSPLPTPTTATSQASNGEKPEEIQNERIVEMQTLMEAAIQKTTNDELKTLQIKLEILEQELRQANERAQLAENELEKYKTREQEHEQKQKQREAVEEEAQREREREREEQMALKIPTPPPPPPPPMPINLLYSSLTPIKKLATCNSDNNSFSGSIASHNINNPKDNHKIIDNVLHQVQAEAATGLDALVREFKSGRVTLRRNRRKTQTNPALQEMFEVLELSQKQNRNSKICIDMHR